jgi:hypothetical protein
MPLVQYSPAAPETGGPAMPKSVAVTSHFRWTTRAEICGVIEVFLQRAVVVHVAAHDEELVDVAAMDVLGGEGIRRARRRTEGHVASHSSMQRQPSYT